MRKPKPVRNPSSVSEPANSPKGNLRSSIEKLLKQQLPRLDLWAKKLREQSRENTLSKSDLDWLSEAFQASSDWLKQFEENEKMLSDRLARSHLKVLNLQYLLRIKIEKMKD